MLLKTVRFQSGFACHCISQDIGQLLMIGSYLILYFSQALKNWLFENCLLVTYLPPEPTIWAKVEASPPSKLLQQLNVSILVEPVLAWHSVWLQQSSHKNPRLSHEWDTAKELAEGSLMRSSKHSWERIRASKMQHNCNMELAIHTLVLCKWAFKGITIERGWRGSKWKARVRVQSSMLSTTK